MSVAVRHARCEAPKRNEASFELYARKGSLESDVRSKDSCVVRRGAIGKVPIEVTRWLLTLLHAPFFGGRGTAMCHAYPAIYPFK